MRPALVIAVCFASNLLFALGWLKFRNAECLRELWVGLAGVLVGFAASGWAWFVLIEGIHYGWK